MRKQRPSFLINHMISNHEKKIIEYFGGYPAVLSDINKRIDDIRKGSQLPASETLVICFTNRSGSNLLAEGIERYSNAAYGGEYFNHPSVIGFCRKRKINSFSEFCIRLQNHTLGKSKKRIFCTKLGQSQLYFLTKIKALPYLLPNPKFVLIKRRDVLAQAVSFSIANQTLKWNNKQEGNGEKAVFQQDDIAKRVKAIVTANAYFDEYFALTGEKCFQFYYEDLVEGFNGKMSELISNLGLEQVATPEYSAISLKRQGNSINQQYSDRMRQVCSLYNIDSPK